MKLIMLLGLVVFRLAQTKSLWDNEDSPEYNQEPLEEQEFKDLFESDIMLTPLQRAALEASFIDETAEHSIQKRKAKAILLYRWPNGVVPYVISNSSANASDVIEAAMQHWMDRTCLSFIPRDAEKDYIYFQNTESLCGSLVGLVGGRQPINIGNRCQHLGTIAHEIGHAIGFWHEQSRPDRDDYVIIHEENIEPGEEHNFRKYSWYEVVTRQIPYDIGSLMHYSSHAFSKNDNATITAVSPADTSKLGNRIVLSSADIKLANAIYYCECKELTTNKLYNYRYMYNPSRTNVTMVEFEVKARKSVYIALTSDVEDVPKLYEIVIGGKRNTKSYIRRCKLCTNKVTVSTPGYLNADEFRDFWISYEQATGLIQVGKKGEAHFMQWQDPNPLHVKYLGYSTGFKSAGTFKFCNW